MVGVVAAAAHAVLQVGAASSCPHLHAQNIAHKFELSVGLFSCPLVLVELSEQPLAQLVVVLLPI